MLNTIVGFVKSIIAKEPARFISYGGIVLLFAADKVAALFGVVLPPEVVTGAQALGALIVTELIRRFVTPVA